MGKYVIEVELLKGDEPVDLPEDYDGDNLTAAVYGADFALKGSEATSVVLYISKNGELLDIMTIAKDAFDVKEVVVAIEDIKERYGL